MGGGGGDGDGGRTEEFGAREKRKILGYRREHQVGVSDKCEQGTMSCMYKTATMNPTILCANNSRVLPDASQTEAGIQRVRET